MHLGVSSPLVALFLDGDVPRDVRLLAARGQATDDGLCRLALLALMTIDSDPDVAALALRTIDGIPPPALDAFFACADPPLELRAWFEARSTALLQASGAPVALPELVEAPLPEDEEEARVLLTSLPVPDKIKIATLGRREQRSILVRDPNRVVSTAVMSSPKLTDVEVENFARMQNVSEEVLRLIGTSRAWTKRYPVIAALVKNPRTPPAVSLPLVTRLAERDMKGLTVDRNVPESIRLAARKQLAVLQSRKS